MGLFVDIPKPKAWPPPPEGSERANELLEYGYKRDPVGDKVHTWIACAFMFSIPQGSNIAGWTFGILFCYSVLRIASTWRTLTPLYRSTLFRLLLAWTCWSLLSILWSSEPHAGLDVAKALRMVLLPLLLWPIIHRWRWLIVSFLAGVFLQNIVQVSEIVGSWFLDGKDWIYGEPLTALGGTEKHTGKAAMFMGFASLMWIGIIATNKRHRKKAILCLLLAIAGMFATVSIAVFIGFSVASLYFLVHVVVKKKISKRGVLLIIIGVPLSLGVAFVSVKDRTMIKVDSAVYGVQEFFDGNIDASSSTQIRLHWWTRTLNDFKDNSGALNWAVGNGMGSVTSINFSTEGSNIPPLADHVHNTYIQILYEQGAVGLLLFLLLLLRIVQATKEMTQRLPELVYPICVSCTVLWAVTTFFENSQSSGRPLAMLILLALFIMYQKVERESVKS